ncbi:MAG: DUF2716 domain-containing protein [Oscillospiraceae bacterium]|nr:DUF2716 domain-containing protein [Oscillospiraceae bacterium]
MQIILDKQQYDKIWDRVYSEFGFRRAEAEWLCLPLPQKRYHLSGIWTAAQEQLVNSIFIGLGFRQMYALDWQHDCFVYTPEEQISPDDSYYDAARECNVYFPSYYPDGDFHFFLTQDFRYGLFGHPWRAEIIVMGDALIEAFENQKAQLLLSDVNEGA